MKASNKAWALDIGNNNYYKKELHTKYRYRKFIMNAI